MRTKFLYALMAIAMALALTVLAHTAHAQSWSNGGTGGGGGGGGPGGTPGGINGSLQYNNAGVFGGTFGGGDVTWNGSSFTVGKTNGVAFAPSATTDTTNATNISSGTIAYARLPSSGVTAGSYTNTNITVNPQGIITSITNGGGGGSVNQIVWSTTAYGALPSCGSGATFELWATQVPGGSCRAHFPPSYVYGSTGSQATVSQTTMSVAIAPNTTGTPTIVGSTLALGGNALSVPSHTDGAGNLLIWFMTNYNAYPSTPAGWHLAGEATNASGGAPIYLSAFTRIPSSEPLTYPQPSGAVFNADAMYSLSNAANSTTPDALTTRNDASSQTGLTAPAMTGLTTSTDMSFNIFAWGSFMSPAGIVADGSIVVDQNTPFNTGTGGSQGLMTAHLALAANTAAAQFANTPSFGTQVCKLFCDGTEYVEEGY